jgi:CubicO group peptidase (beta-lactamase class C family)
VTISSEHSQAVDAVFSVWDRPDSPGCAVGVYHDGQVVHARGYGMASLELDVPLGPSSVFHVASVSKQFCAICATLLANAGSLSLDDDIRTHVPEMPDLGHLITVRNLIHHTSGLRDQYGLFRLAGWRDGDAQTNADVLDFAYRHQRLNFEPGSQYAYCNTSYTLLALIVARGSGKSLREYAHEQIFEPLGMHNTLFLDDRSAIVCNRANAYQPGEADGFLTMNSNVDAVGAICLYTSVEDQLKWLKNLRQRTVAGEVLDAAMTSGVLNSGEQTHYGYGMAIETYRGLRTVDHGGVDSGYRSQLTYFPEVDFGVVVLANLSNIKPEMLALQVADIFLEDRLGARGLAEEPVVSLSADQQQQATGIYIHPLTRQVRRIELSDGKLVMPSGFGPDLELTPVAANRFRVDDPPHELRILPANDWPQQLEEIAINGRSDVFDRAETVSPTAEDLAGYVGTYSCPEIDAIHRVYLEDGRLWVKQRKTAAQSLKPASADIFVLPMVALVFGRDGHGQVSHFELFNDRIRYLRFTRL